MKRSLLIILIIILIIVNIQQTAFSNNNELLNNYEDQIIKENYMEQINSNNLKLKNNEIIKKSYHQSSKNSNFGVWIHTKYNGISDEKKLDIDISTFTLMIKGGGWKNYKITMENSNDTDVNIQFSGTKIFLEDEDEFVDVLQVRFNVETSCNTNEDFEVSLEIRFPFSLLDTIDKSEYSIINFIKNNNLNFNENQIRFNEIFNLFKSKFDSFFKKIIYRNQLLYNSDSYFCVKIGYYSPENDEGPNRVDTRFFFGRNSIFDPKVFRMKITPYELNNNYKLQYNNSYLTVDQSGNEIFYRTFSVEFEPAVELQVTSIPGKGKISYNFGNSQGVKTKILFNADGGIFTNIHQSFIVDPLPESMSFDLTILGERSFRYESDSRYSVKYIMESIDEGNIINLELENLPKKITAEWGLKIFLLSLSGSGFVDLNMSEDLDRMALKSYDSEVPFIEINNFPQKLRVDGFIDVPSLQGFITTSKYSGDTTTINIPLKFDKWEILTTIYFDNGYGSASFNLPDENSNFVSIGFDTNDNSLFGLGLALYDLELDKQVLEVRVDAIATDDLLISFNYISSEIDNLAWSGKITELLDFIISIDYDGIAFDLTGSWTIGDNGFFEFEINQDIAIYLDQVEYDNVILDGTIGLHPGTKIIVEWERGDIGFFKIQIEGIDFTPEIQVIFYDKNSNEIFITGSIILNPNCILKFDWEWDETGHFTIFTNNIIENVNFEVGYNFNQYYNEYEYGFKISNSEMNLIRTIQWDTENGFIPRIWILGDNEIPDSWNLFLLWKYEWYEVN